MATPASTIQDRIKLHHWEIIRFDIGAKYNPLEELICPMPSRDLAAPVAFAKSSNSKPAPMATTRTGSIADRMVFREVTSDNWPTSRDSLNARAGLKLVGAWSGARHLLKLNEQTERARKPR